MKPHGRVTPSGHERPASRAGAVRLEGITKRFGGTVAVDALSLEVEPGEFVCLLGPSGCGKTTTMRIIAGFVEPDSGQVFINGEDVSRRHPNRRDIGMVYQSYALFPHMTVAENVAFGLRMRRIPQDRMTTRVAGILDLVGLAGLGDRKPSQLSGGQQQRVALARAMVIEPTVLLLDEPLSNLDAKLRKRMQVELKTLQRTVGITTIHVTHDQEEALTLADRVVILNHGRVEQIGAPRVVYARPGNVFVADFLGKANFLPGEIATSEDPSSRVVVRTEVGDLVAEPDGQPWPVGTPVEAFVRPERIDMRGADAALTENTLSARIERVVFSGPTVSVEVRLATGRALTLDRPGGELAETLAPGRPLIVVIPPAALRLLRRPGDTVDGR
jgi:putative spermidine/putrescine transport system ATP-binding protein